MTYLCPACKRSFDEAGFCPFDRTQLVSGAISDLPTVVSAAMPVVEPVVGPHRTDVDPRRGTFPLTPGPRSDQKVTVIAVENLPSASLQPTNERPRLPQQPPPQLRAVSASENPSEALEAYRAKSHEMDRLVGETLDGRYFVENKIGEGGMGVVFSARHAVIERPLAIKVLKREVMRDTATIRRFIQEARAASRIGHPNIVDVTDFGTTPDGLTFSVMEYISGRTLGAALRDEAPFPTQRALRIAAQIARALGAAHDKGIVHRDLKPENVFLLDRDGRPDFVKIVDFGIAKVTPLPGAANEPRLTRAGSVFGTPEYMAPEQAAGRSDTDGRVDIYALGVILYEMLCGKVPHRGDSMVRTLAMQMLDPAEPPSKVRPDLGIAPELEAVVMTALAKKREQRYQTMGELLSALDDVARKVLPPPIGQSVTGSPVYLTPLPPGADPNLVATPGVGVAPVGPPSVPADPPRAKPPTRRLKDEPEFVTGGSERPLTFDHVTTEDMPAVEPRRWPLVLFGGLIVGGAAGAIGFVIKSRNDVEQPVEHRPVVAVVADAATGPADAAVVTTVGDAEVIAEADAATPDAGRVVVVVPHHSDAGVRTVPRPHDAGVVAFVPDTPNHRGTIGVQVLTKPEGATLYVGTTYRGPGGTTLEEPLGTSYTVTCKNPGYAPGKVDIAFDGKSDVVLCAMKRIKICIDNIKNVFDDCEIDPTKPMP
jgi:serine/threonine protein kinase